MAEVQPDPTAHLQLIEAAQLGKLLLRGQPGIVAAAATGLGFALPDSINHAADGTAGRAIRLGPDEHLLLLEPGRLAEVVRSLGEALADRHFALVDLSARLVAFELIGSSAGQTPARDTLAAACPLDLDPGACKAEQATRTILGKAEIILDCLGADHFRLLTNRSFGDYVRQLLLEAGRELGLERSLVADAS